MQPINKSTIKNDPFASVIPIQTEEHYDDPETKYTNDIPEEVEIATSPPPLRQSTRKTRVPEPVPENDTRPIRQKLTIHLDIDLADRVKNAAYWNPRLTIAKIAERGIRLAIAEVEKENKGPYPMRESELVGGRPIK